MNQKNSKLSQQLKHISDITYLEESTNMRLILRGIATITTLILILFIWSAFIHITETTKSFGELVPEGEVPVVQHLEGGIVENVLIKEGQAVKQGQLLVKLKTAELESQLQELKSQEIGLELIAERLTAFLDNKPPTPELWTQKILSSKYDLVGQKAEIDNLIQHEVALLEAEYAKLQDKKAVLTNELDQRKAQLEEYLNKKKIWITHMELLEKEFAMYSKLKNTNYISSKDYLTIIRTLNQAKGAGADLDSQAEQTREAIKESENKLKEAESSAREKALEDLSKTKTTLMEIYYKIEKGTQQIERSNIKSPIDGIVKGLNLFPGSVLKPGEEVLHVVPQNEKLVGETKIPPREIGYIKVGNPVKIKILTYDYARFGSINGKLVNISATTFLDAEGNPYYKTKISLDTQRILVKGSPQPLMAGMTIECDIITGSKSLLDYLLKPIHRAVTESFHER